MYQVRGGVEAPSTDVTHIMFGDVVLCELPGRFKDMFANGTAIMLHFSMFIQFVLCAVVRLVAAFGADVVPRRVEYVLLFSIMRTERSLAS